MAIQKYKVTLLVSIELNDEDPAVISSNIDEVITHAVDAFTDNTNAEVKDFGFLTQKQDNGK